LTVELPLGTIGHFTNTTLSIQQIEARSLVDDYQKDVIEVLKDFCNA
jgi:hypothetical protein